MEQERSWGFVIRKFNKYPDEWRFIISIGKRSTEKVYRYPFWKAFLKFIFSWSTYDHVLRIRNAVK